MTLFLIVLFAALVFEYINGFHDAAIVIQSASHFGIPLSTTHVISSSIMGVGASKRLSAVKWGLVSRIIWAWVLTLPITGLIGYLSCRLLHWFGCN